MSDSTHKAKLLEGAAAWNAWRSKNPDTVPDLRGLTIPFDQRQLSPDENDPINLSHAQLGGSELLSAQLTGADFYNATLTGANLADAELCDVDFSDAELIDVNFQGADLTNANLEAANLSGANLGNTTGLTQGQVNRAAGDEATVLPEGLERPAHWSASFVQPEDQEEPLDLESYEIGLFANADLYELLNVARDAAPEVIHKAYIAAVKTCHPDRYPGDRMKEEKFKALNTGVAILMDPEQRAQYDNGEIDAEGNPKQIYSQPQQGGWWRVVVGASCIVIVACAGIAGYWSYFGKPSFLAHKSQERASLHDQKQPVKHHPTTPKSAIVTTTQAASTQQSQQTAPVPIIIEAKVSEEIISKDLSHGSLAPTLGYAVAPQPTPDDKMRETILNPAELFYGDNGSVVKTASNPTLMSRGQFSEHTSLVTGTAQRTPIVAQLKPTQDQLQPFGPSLVGLHKFLPPLPENQAKSEEASNRELNIKEWLYHCRIKITLACQKDISSCKC